MNQLEENIVNSFRLAKSDIIKLQSEVLSLGEIQKKIIQKLDDVNTKEQLLNQKLETLSNQEEVLNKKLAELGKTEKKLHDKVHEINILITEKLAKKPKTITKTITKKVPARKKVTYVASKSGKKFHITHCPFARNIKPKSQVKFKSKNTALNNGYKPCDCV